MKYILLGLVSFLFFYLSAIRVDAHEIVFGRLVIKHPVIRVLQEADRKAEGYVEISNIGTKNEKLIGATLEGANKSQLFPLQKPKGAISKILFKDGIEIKAGHSLRLGPKNDFILFEEIYKKYDEDTYIAGSLIFAFAGSVKIEFLVASSQEDAQKLSK